MKTTIELDDRDWGRIAIAVQQQLNMARNAEYSHDGWTSEARKMQDALDVAAWSRIKASFTNQRRKSRVSAKTKREAARDVPTGFDPEKLPTRIIYGKDGRPIISRLATMDHPRKDNGNG